MSAALPVTLTPKNVSLLLHRKLNEHAKRHKRSLNQEAILCLERAVSATASAPTLADPPPPVSLGVMKSMNGWHPTERGTPQGAIISPLLANTYLDPLDHLMITRGWKMTRYADDLIIQCHSEAEARAALVAVQAWMAEAGRLSSRSGGL